MATMHQLFHVTHNDNELSIKSKGLDPKRSRGRMPAVWLVADDRIPWAIAHICDRDRVLPNELSVLAVLLDTDAINGHSAPGVYYTWHPVEVRDIDMRFIPATRFLVDPQEPPPERK